MRRLWLLAPAGLAAALLALPALADNVRTNWQEAWKPGGQAQMTFTVHSIDFKNKGWVVDASFKNASKTTVKMTGLVGLFLMANDSVTPQALAKGQPLEATSVSWPLPTILHPGDSWSGTFSGTGTPPHGAFVRVIFGRFTGGVAGAKGFYWITDHAYRFVQLPSQTSA